MSPGIAASPLRREDEELGWPSRRKRFATLQSQELLAPHTMQAGPGSAALGQQEPLVQTQGSRSAHAYAPFFLRPGGSGLQTPLVHKAGHSFLALE